MMLRQLGNLLGNTSGSTATIAGVLAVPLIMAGGVAIDYTSLARIKDQLQAAADAAALASAKELALASAKNDAIEGAAKNYVHASLERGLGMDSNGHKVAIKTDIASNRQSVTVDLSYTWKPLIIQYLYASALPVKVDSTASLAGAESICVIALKPKGKWVLAMTGVSTLSADNCSVYSNSIGARGIKTVKGAMMKATNTYSSGGYGGPASTYAPTPITDSPAIPDPLVSRPAPKVGACDEKGLTLTKGSHTLNPGTYCGGITLKGKTDVKLKPGEYIIKDGPLSVGGDSTIAGQNVGFYFTGDTAVFDFGVSTQIDITAPKSGPLSGILFFEDRSAPQNREFVIRSKDAERFEGTVYLSRGKFIVDKASRVGQNSKWTAIIARMIEIRKGPNIQINSDYAGSSIPVPEGVGPNGNKVRLTN